MQRRDTTPVKINNSYKISPFGKAGNNQEANLSTAVTFRNILILFCCCATVNPTF